MAGVSFRDFFPILLCLLLAVSSLTALGVNPAAADDITIAEIRKIQTPVLGEGLTLKTSVNPRIKEYKVSRNLANVKGINILNPLTSKQRTALARHGFVITPSKHNDFYEIYYKNPAPFISADVMFHAYLHLVHVTLKNMEELLLAEMLKEMTAGARANLEKMSSELSGLPEQAALDALFILCTAQALIDPEAPIPPELKERVSQELDLINTARFIGEIEGRLRDYTIFRPATGYEANPRLTRYFKAYRFLSTQSVRFETEQGALACLFLSLALHADKKTWDRFKKFTWLCRWLTGPPDDPAPIEVLQAAREDIGNKITKELLADRSKIIAFMDNLKALPRATVNDQPNDDPGADPADDAGMRVLAPGLTLRASFFQALADLTIMPSGTHTAHVLGNNAVELSGRETDVLAEFRSALAEQETAEMENPSLYTEAMYVLSRLNIENTDGYPMFMKAEPWALKTANTQMAGWSEIEHAVFLYAKGFDVAMDGEPRQGAMRGYVEPAPHFYAALASLVHRTRTAFEKIGGFKDKDERKRIRKERMEALLDRFDRGEVDRVLPPGRIPGREHYEKLEGILKQLKVMAEKELANKKFNKKENMLLDDIHDDLKYLALNESNIPWANEPMSIVVRAVRERLNKIGLHVGIGRPFEITVLAPWGGKIYACRGAVYSYYEFTRPLTEPINDVEWKKETAKPWPKQAERPWLFKEFEGLEWRFPFEAQARE